MSRPLNRVNCWIGWYGNEILARTGAQGTASAPSLAELRGRLGGSGLVVLGRSASLVKKVRVPNVKAQELQQLLSIQATQLFSSGREPIVSGYQLSDDISAEGRLVTLMGVPKSLLDQIYAECKSIGVPVVGAMPTAMGSVLIAKEHQLKDAVVVEPSPEGIGIDIVLDGALAYSRLAPHASPVAPEIQRALVASQSGTLPVIAHSSITEITTPYRFSMSTFETLAGSSATLGFGRIEPLEAIAKRERGEVASRSRLAVLMAVAAIGCGAIVWDYRGREAALAQSQRGAFLSEIREAKKLKDSAQKRNSDFVADLNLLKRLFVPAQPPSDVITVVGNLAPKDVWLTGVSFERGKPIQVRGVALTNDAVGTFLESMSTSDRLRDAKLVFANQTTMESTSVVQFSVTAHVVGNVPSLKTKEEKKKR